ncbi:MAG: hypothetical protein IJX24_01290 [Oscillospiraceae bacterium]|nr:hypothetical protein [Oscillospiraceae bacterium]
MEGIINKIIEIDKKAEEKLIRAKSMQQQSASEAIEECRILEEKLNCEADDAISVIEAVNKEDYEKLSEINEKKYADEKRNMSDFYEENHLEIERQIFEEIVGEIS